MNGVWSDRLIEILTPNALELHGDLQRLDYDLDDMHTPYSNIE
jgi:hypothetical protein